LVIDTIATTDECADDETHPGSTSLPGSPAPLLPGSPAPSLPNALARRLSAPPIQIAAALLLVFAVMRWIEFGGPAILDNDGYYHIRWATMLRQSFPHLPAFKALPLTTLDEQHYVDHHYLFHVMLVPFTFGDLRLGAKAAAVVFSSLGITSIFALLVVWRVRFKWLWLAPLVAGSEHFLYRMSMTRAPALSLALLGIGTYLIFKRKHVWLALLSFVFVWAYSLFPLMFAFAFAYSITRYLADRRIDLWASLASALGILTGLVINPYFPKDLTLFGEHFLMKSTANYSVDVGVEWYPYETWAMLEVGAVVFAIFFIALLAFQYRDRVRDPRPLFFLIVSMMLLLLMFKSRRFIEYWPPFAILFAAFTLGLSFERVNLRWLANTRDRVMAATAAAIVSVALLVGMGLTLWRAHEDVKSEADPFAYRGAAEWIAQNTPPGSKIFNTDWDDFPMLFYYSPGNTYVAGLDPTYLYDRDPELWKLYANITLGDESDPAPLIRDRFGAEYVFTDNEHLDFMQIAEDSGDFEKVYTDEFTTVLRVRGLDEPRPSGEDGN